MNNLIFTIKRCYKPITENRIWQQMYVQCDFFRMLKCEMYKSRHFLCVNQQKDQEFSFDLSGALKVTHNV